MTATMTDTRAAGPRSFVDDVFDRPGSIRAMALLRIALGPVVIAHLWPFLRASARGTTYEDHFNEPWWTWMPSVPGGVQTALVWTGAATAIALTIGWRTRWAAALTWCCVAGNFFLSQHHFRHNRAFLLYLLGAVVLSESGRVLSVDARRRLRRDQATQDQATQDQATQDQATIWPMYTLRALASSVYFASGFSKLIDTDWSGGLVLWDRAVRHQHFVRDSVLPEPIADLVIDLVTARWFHTLTSPLAVAMELFIAIGLWFGPTRLAAVWTAIFFHLSIEVSASVEVFSAAAIVALAIWATPNTRDRRVITPDGRWVRRLDWLARFDVDERTDATQMVVIDRDGRERTGRSAEWLVWSRLPVTFFFIAPLRRWWR